VGIFGLGPPPSNDKIRLCRNLSTYDEIKNNRIWESALNDTKEKIHTHYDNLKVARNAPVEVIRAAYKTLSQKYHPDRHGGSADATRVMTLLNTSYEVLSDPVKRQEHDAWIEKEEHPPVKPQTRPHAQANSAAPRQEVPPPSPPTQAMPVVRAPIRSVLEHIWNNWRLYALVAVLIWIYAADRAREFKSAPMPYQAVAPVQVRKTAPPPPPAPVVAKYVRPITAPDGGPWPALSGYLSNAVQSHGDGLSTVTVDNSKNDSDVFVKLVSLDSANAYPARVFLIRAFDRFTVKDVRAGSYDIRYRDLTNGQLSRSERFRLQEISTEKGTQYSNITMTLYKVRNGNMQTYGLSEAEF
jgi:hypothetical protein